METLIGTLLTGLSAVLIALGGFWAQVGKKRAFDRKAANQEQERLEKQVRATRRHAIRCELLLEENGVQPPRRPPEMALDWGVQDDEGGEEPKQKAVKA